MKKKIIVIYLVLIVTVMFTTLSTPVEIDASSGTLKSNTVRKCKGKWYGKHSNHWHAAKKNKKNKRWYAIGPNLGKSKPKVCR